MKEPTMEMPAHTPEPEKNPAARMMTAAEMSEFADVLMMMRDGGYGDRTINEMVAQLDDEVMRKMGKKDLGEMVEELNSKEK